MRISIKEIIRLGLVGKKIMLSCFLIGSAEEKRYFETPFIPGDVEYGFFTREPDEYLEISDVLFPPEGITTNTVRLVVHENDAPYLQHIVYVNVGHHLELLKITI